MTDANFADELRSTIIELRTEIQRLRSENKDLRTDRDIALADAQTQSDIADEHLTQLFDARAEIDILRNDIANLNEDMDDISAEIANRSMEVFNLRRELKEKDDLIVKLREYLDSAEDAESWRCVRSMIRELTTND